MMPADSVVLEVFFIRFPVGEPEANVDLWREVDELQFPVELRQHLADNGFRLGLIGGQVPPALAKLLELEEKPPPGGAAGEVDVGDLEQAPRVVRRHLSISAGRRKEIVTSGVYEELPVLIRESGRLRGQTYHKAQTLLAMKTYPQPDGRVRLELVPEIQYGQPRQRWVGDQGMFRLEAGRPRRALTEMRTSATLSPGSMLLMTCLPSRPGSLGHHFFTQDDGQLKQKLLVVRLCQTQHNLFAPPEAASPGREAR